MGGCSSCLHRAGQRGSEGMDLFSSREIEDGQDSSKARKGKEGINLVPNFSQFFCFHLCHSVSCRI